MVRPCVARRFRRVAHSRNSERWRDPGKAVAGMSICKLFFHRLEGQPKSTGSRLARQRKPRLGQISDDPILKKLIETQQQVSDATVRANTFLVVSVGHIGSKCKPNNACRRPTLTVGQAESLGSFACAAPPGASSQCRAPANRQAAGSVERHFQIALR
jgi:hypothetical protein